MEQPRRVELAVRTAEGQRLLGGQPALLRLVGVRSETSRTLIAPGTVVRGGFSMQDERDYFGVGMPVRGTDQHVAARLADGRRERHRRGLPDDRGASGTCVLRSTSCSSVFGTVTCPGKQL